MNRRTFLTGLGAGALCLGAPGCRHTPSPAPSRTQPIRGSWISVWWDDRRHVYWNDAALKFSARQWQLAVQDMSELGFEYLVLLAVAKGGKAFYQTPLLPKLELACDDPIEAMLTAADRCRVKFFISSDWFGDWDEHALLAPERMATRFQMMEELVRLYGHHKSFYGWYWPNEAHITPYFYEPFIQHVNACSAEARRLMPKAKTLTAPYGTKNARADDTFVAQLERLDVDIIAYQDEVGCLRMTPDQSRAAYEKLRLAHNRVPQRALWADVETFAWEGEPNRQTSPLIPAPFARVQAQLEAVSPFVDKILIYQYQGLMNRQNTRAFAGHPDSVRLCEDYVAWLRQNHPALLRGSRALATPRVASR
ncbi:MAG TPA: DUF4434 domain-containing protein [Clostridia bacterium]|nr:DUF4434 domain-containing protein [Clostridia bacterium]